MVKVQENPISKLGIKRFAVIGGSMGGMQTLEWAKPNLSKINAAIPIATSYRHSAQNIAFHEIGRQAIMADPGWNKGDYYKKKVGPRRGLCCQNDCPYNLSFRTCASKKIW